MDINQRILMAKYKNTETDKKNKQWFANNKACNTLQKIAIEQSSIRGLGLFEMEFKYPVSVIVGENGCGKSTILALVSCAFHNQTSFCPTSLLSNKKKQRHYYTYSDFFAFTAAERGFMSDIHIKSHFLTDKTKNTDVRRKAPRGKWIDYDSRPKRAVSFLGINRILPPSESITYRNYSAQFVNNKLQPSESADLAKYMQQIFGKDYSAVTMTKHHKYRLYGCSKSTVSYTGFNMGAGENAVLQLLHEIMSAGKGALIVVDEIELGLHVKAQRMLMRIIKELCLKNNSQLICSSHSATILNSVPYDGRIMLKTKSGGFDIVYGVSSEMAMSELSGLQCPELEIIVEDDVARDFLHAVLPNTLRKRVNIMILGSADSSILHAVATHIRENHQDFLVVMDGDKRALKNDKIKTVVASLDDCKTITKEEIQKFLEDRIVFLPGDTWPEKVFFDSLCTECDLTRLMEDCNVCDSSEMKEYISNALAAGKHSEFYQLASDLCLDESTVRMSVIRQYHTLNASSVQPIINTIENALD